MGEEKTSKKILIIDDEKSLVFGLDTLLKSQGYLTIAAYDSVFGISSAHKDKPDLIILDLGLPAGGGLYVLENLKDSLETHDIPIIVLTAQQGKDLEEKVKQMGAAAYFHKPFESQQLLSQLNDMLNKS
jgi:DNA-binding response OmpR family regulator